MKKDPTSRFSHTVDNYIRYRPGYPAELLGFMGEVLGFSPSSVVADIGSGTGKLTELFLQNGNPCLAVEPNQPMREAAERLFGHYPQLHSLHGTAEATNLPSGCADFVVAAQAFHWFDQTAARAEFQRILRPEGVVLLLWNDRNDERSPFMRDYDAFLRAYSTDLDLIDHRLIGAEQLKPFFGQAPGYRQIDYLQRFDWAGLKGRYLSCSYAFDEKHDRHHAAMQALSDTFDAHAVSGTVDFWYLTKVYYGVLQ